jgi:hypothetical protein
MAWHGTQSIGFAGYATSFLLAPPPTAQMGDLLVAVLALGNSTPDPAPRPTFTAPAGWTLLDRVDSPGFHNTLVVYSQNFNPTSGSEYVWSTDTMVHGEGWISAYDGVAADRRLVVAHTAFPADGLMVFQAPAVMTSVTSLLVVNVASETTGATTSWTSQLPWMQRGSADNGAPIYLRSGATFDRWPVLAGISDSVQVTSTAPQQDRTLLDVIAFPIL